MTKQEFIQEVEEEKWYLSGEKWKIPQALLGLIICENETINGWVLRNRERLENEYWRDTYHIITNTRYIIFEIALEKSKIVSITLNKNSKIQKVVEEHAHVILGPKGYEQFHGLGCYTIEIFTEIDELNSLKFSSEDFVKSLGTENELRNFITQVYNTLYNR